MECRENQFDIYSTIVKLLRTDQLYLTWQTQELIQNSFIMKDIPVNKAAMVYAASILTKFSNNPFKQLEITIPFGYRHENYLSVFSKRVKHKISIDPEINDNNFLFQKKDMFTSAEDYQIEVWEIKRTVSYKECSNFLIIRDLMPVGPRGLGLFYENLHVDLSAYRTDYSESSTFYSLDPRINSQITALGYSYSQHERHGAVSTKSRYFFKKKDLPRKLLHTIEENSYLIGFRKI